MKIVQYSSFIERIIRFLNPLINFLFPEIKRNNKAKKEIAMNMVANILGIGNASTPLGLKAMETLQDENLNKETLSNSMAMLIILNSSSLQIIPTTIIAIRVSMESQNPTSIIVPVWITTMFSAITGIIAVKFFIIKEKTHRSKIK